MGLPARHARRPGRRRSTSSVRPGRARSAPRSAGRTSRATAPPSGWSWTGSSGHLAALRVLGFARTLQRRRDLEGGDEAADAAVGRTARASYFHHRDRDPALFPDTLPCLDALRARYRLGLLSNGSRLPEKVGLAQYFESVVFAQDHRVAKPDKGIFEVVERELGVEPRGLRARGRPPAQRRGRGQACRLARRVDRPRRRRGLRARSGLRGAPRRGRHDALRPAGRTADAGRWSQGSSG